MVKFATEQKIIYGILTVRWSDGSITRYSPEALGVEWLNMSNDAFFKKYGFSFNPHKFPGLYERCRERLNKK